MLSAELEKRLDQFESSWTAANGRNFDTQIQDLNDAQYTEMLAELIMIDLELRYRQGAQGSEIELQLARYFNDYPQIADHPLFHRKIKAHWKALQQSSVASDEALTAENGEDQTKDNELVSVGLKLPYEWGKFRLTRVLGRGAMGIVYEGLQQAPQRTVAIKVLAAESSDDSEAITRFSREIELLSKIDHPGVVPVYEAGAIDDRNFFVMPILRGGTLRQKIQQGQLLPRESAEVMWEIAISVAVAHTHGVVHRDLKPSNVLFGDDGRPRIADFGLARLYDRTHDLTRTGQICGTPGYIAPERIAATNSIEDERPGDIYSLGAILYDTLCGRPPFRGPTVWETMQQAISIPPVPPSQLNPAVDRDLETICLKCLEREPNRRYPSARELADDLDRYLRGQSIKARRPGLIERMVRDARRHPMRSSLIAATILLIIVGLTSVYLLQQLSIRDREVQAVQMLRDGETYLARMAEARELLAQRETPWREKTLSLISEAASLPLPSRDDIQLRTLMATAAVQPDLEPVATILEGIWCDCLAFDPSGRYLALGQNKDDTGFAVWIYRTDNWKAEPYQIWIDCADEIARRKSENHPKPEDGARALAFSPDGRQLAVGTRHGRLHLFNWVDGKASHLSSFDPHPGVEVARVEFFRNGRSIWVLSDKGKLRVITDGKVEHHPFRGDATIVDMVVSPTEDAIFVIDWLHSGPADHILQRYEFGNRKPTWKRSTGRKTPAEDLAISPDGRYLACSMFNTSKIEVVETELGKLRSSIGLDDPLQTGRVDLPRFSNSDSFLVTTSFERVVTLWDVVQGNAVATHLVSQRGGRPKVVASPTQPLVAVTEHLKTTIFRISGNDICRTAGHSAAPIRDITRNSRGNRIASAGSLDGTVDQKCMTFSILDPQTSKLLFRYFMHKGTHIKYPVAPPIVFGPQDEHLVSATWRTHPLMIPSRILSLNELNRWRVGDHAWIKPQDIEVSAATTLENVSDNSGVFDSLLPVVPNGEQEIRLVCQPDAEYFVRKRRHAFVVIRLEAEAETPTYAWVKSKLNEHTALELPLGESPDRFIAVWAGHHDGHLVPQIKPLEIGLRFDKPVKKILLAGVVLSSDPLDALARKEMPSSQKLGPVASHTGSQTLWTVLNSDHLQVVDYGDVFSQRQFWTNQLISNDLRLGTLEPVLSTEKWVVCGTIAGEIFVFDPDSAQMVNSAIPKQAKIRGLCQLANSDRCVAAMNDGSFQVLDLPSLNVVQTEKHHRLSVEAICYDASRGWLLAGSEDGTISVWQTVDGQFEHYFSIDLKRGPIRRMLYLEPSDQLAVVVNGETAIRQIKLDTLCRYLRQLEPENVGHSQLQ